MQEFVKPFDEKMTKTVSVLKENLACIRAGRANPSVLDRVSISYYGVDTPISQVASIAVTEARTLTISPWDKTQLKVIEKAIQASDVGINPQNDGQVLRLLFPALTEERRKELAKQILKYGEESKVAIRSIRRDANDKLKTAKKNSEMPEDVISDLEDECQKLTDDYCQKIDDICAKKSKEIMEF